MRGAYLRGMGLSCALGTNAEMCLSALQRGPARSVTVTLTDFTEPLRMVYYRIPDGADLFDCGRFTRLLTAAAQTAVRQANLTATDIRRLPLFIGSSCFSVGQSETEYAQALAKEPQHALPMPVCGYQHIAVAVQRALGCTGDTYTYNTACTSSANALLGALGMLELGWHHYALVLGVELANRTSLAGFSGLQLVAENLKPFDTARQGLVLGEAVSAVLLSQDANHADGLRLVGGASNCDTASVTTANPDGESVAAVLRAAIASAQLEPQQIRGIKAHGTATSAGDTAEAAGLRKVFVEMPPVSVIKPYLGHTLGACGAAELVLYGGTLQRGFMPATPGFENPDPALDLRPLTRRLPAPAGCYLLNHFGFGGNNTVLVLEKTAA